MNSYKIITPELFTQEHLNYIDDFKKSINMISLQSDLILGAKDTNSRHIISTNSYATIVGLTNGNDVANMLDKEMPCENTAQYADCYVQEDKSLLDSLDPTRGISVLNIHNYSDGLKARVFKKHILHHKPTNSILGTLYTGYDVNLQNYLSIIPSFIIRFGITGSFEAIDKNTTINDFSLTDYEQEVCFLILLNWDFKQIADFMNQTRPEYTNRSSDTIIKKKNYLCNKFNLKSTNIENLQEFLVSIGFHNKMPFSFYNRIIGSKVLAV